MRTLLSAVAAVAVVSVFGVSEGQAATVNIATDEGSLHVSESGIRSRTDKDGVLKYHTNVSGWDLEGMEVVAKYADGTSETMSWVKMGDDRSNKLGGVSGSGLSLGYVIRDWTLTTTKSLVKLIMDPTAANAIFDMLPDEGTTNDTIGTSFGFAYNTRGGDALDGEINVEYVNGVYVRGHDRAADTFTKMIVDYSGLAGGGLMGTTVFRTDLDSLAVKGDLTPVPLPAGLPLLAAGLFLLAPLRNRKS